LTPFFGTSLAYDEAKEVADGRPAVLKQSWPIGQSGVSADGAELVLIDYVNKKRCV
jgi:hypothetical protein